MLKENLTVKKLSRKEAQEVTRARLIEVATRIFTRYGFERASVDTVAREVGVTKGAVYANFATKEDLFLAVLDHFRKIAQFIEQYLSEEGRKGSLASEVFASVVIAVSNGLEMQQIIDSEAIPDDLFTTILPLFVQQLSQPNSNLDLFS